MLLEAADELTAGCLFVRGRSFYFSLADWVLIFRLQRFDALLALTSEMKTKILNCAASESNLGATVEAEVRGLITQLSRINNVLLTFRQQANNTDPLATTVAPPVTTTPRHAGAGLFMNCSLQRLQPRRPCS